MTTFSDPKRSDPTLLTRINPKDLGPMVRKMNKGLMVQFINRDLLNRAALDVRKSVVLYDENGLFEYALEELPSDNVQRNLLTKTNIRSYSIGV